MNGSGIIYRISGPVVEARDVSGIRMSEQVEVAEERLIGEVIRLEGDRAIIQVYEETTGIKPGDKIYGTGLPLSVELGPGLIGKTFDGIQRPLELIKRETGVFVQRGTKLHPLDRAKRWNLKMEVKVGQEVHPYTILGRVQESELVEHRILVPPAVEGEVTWVIQDGEYTVDTVICKVRAPGGERQLTMFHRWPVRMKRPVQRRLDPTLPLITGQRVLDFFFPLAVGGVAAIPGGFGTGKTVTQHSLAKWAHADVIIYIGCGERGNEMTEVLKEFPQLIDPRSGRPLMERTILIANTSNMPVTARESSIYTGITLGEYYRDMGYNVAIMADSTSRWAEALREISGRLEEMPAEEGFPAYLPSRLAEFYERAGRAVVTDEREGSVSIIGAVSPPGGDFSEPVTQHTKRFVRAFWALDKDLASARHFPAISWLDSYSGYISEVKSWWEERFDIPWTELRSKAMELLQEEARLQQIARLIGPDALPDAQRLILAIAEVIKEAFLQQNALSPEDAYCTPEKSLRMMQVILHFYDRARRVISRGAPIFKVTDLPVLTRIMRMKTEIGNDQMEKFDSLIQEIDHQMEELESRYE